MQLKQNIYFYNSYSLCITNISLTNLLAYSQFKTLKTSNLTKLSEFHQSPLSQ